jgi:hypothetical protein
VPAYCLGALIILTKPKRACAGIDAISIYSGLQSP